MILRIAIYGSECTGKTTLAKHLADHYATFWVAEYSREYAERKPLLDISDVVPIIRGQIDLEEEAIRIAEKQGLPLLICDTIPLSSIAYSLYYNHDVPEEAKALAKRHYDLYLLTDTDVPWQADGIRGHNIDRAAMHQLFHQQLLENHLHYTLLTGTQTQRFNQATQLINQQLQNKAGDSH